MGMEPDSGVELAAGFGYLESSVPGFRWCMGSAKAPEMSGVGVWSLVMSGVALGIGVSWYLESHL